jgi:hypothetical protein
MPLPLGLSSLLTDLRDEGTLEIEEVGHFAFRFIQNACSQVGVPFDQVEMVILLPSNSVDYDSNVSTRFPQQIKADDSMRGLFVILVNDKEWEVKALRRTKTK